MKNLLFVAAGTLILAFVPCLALALEQSPNAIRQTGGFRAEPNQQQMMQQREMLREQTRKRILERAEQRRRGPNDINSPVRVRDSNTPITRRPPDPGKLLADIEQRMADEQAKHLDRFSRLGRIRELAQQQNNTQSLARVDSLIEQENKLFDAKLLRLKHRKDRLTDLMQKGMLPDVNRKPVAPDINKVIEKPKLEKK